MENIPNKIGTLIHYGSPFFNPLKFRPSVNRDFVKPSNGLWTSPVNSEYGWKKWCHDNDFRDCTEENSFKMRLKQDAKVLVINCESDLEIMPFQRTLLPHMFFLDFEKISEEYDAIWLTVNGEHETRWSQPQNMYGWDCETVYFMNSNCFELVD